MTSVKKNFLSLAFASMALVACAGGSDPQSTAIPSVSTADQAVLPTAESQLTWSTAQKVVGHRIMNVIFQSHLVPASGFPSQMPKDPNLTLTYTVNGDPRKIEGFLDRTSGTSLLVIKNGRIVYEQYANGNTEEHAASSRSMAKSMASVVVGLAVKDGKIASLDDKVTKYVPELAGGMYERVSLREMLQMTSGVPYYENPADTRSDLTPLQGCLLKNQARCLVDFAKDLSTRPGAVPKRPGSTFQYSTADAVVMGIVVERAVGMPAATYLSEKVWKPFGMERDGYWNVESTNGNVFGGSGFGASLRDYGRFGLYLMRNGVLSDGTATLPDNWMAESTKGSAANPAYGYFWWLDTQPAGAMSGQQTTYYARGSSGQLIVVNPAENLVIVKTAAAEGGADETALVAAITNRLH